MYHAAGGPRRVNTYMLNNIESEKGNVILSSAGSMPRTPLGWRRIWDLFSYIAAAENGRLGIAAPSHCGERGLQQSCQEGPHHTPGK